MLPRPLMNFWSMRSCFIFEARSARAAPLPAHPEGPAQHVAVVRVERDVLAAALGLRELAADEPIRELLALRVATDDAHRVLRRADLRPHDLAPHDVLLEVTAHHLDFGKLHSVPLVRLGLDGALGPPAVGLVRSLVLRFLLRP